MYWILDFAYDVLRGADCPEPEPWLGLHAQIFVFSWHAPVVLLNTHFFIQIQVSPYRKLRTSSQSTISPSTSNRTTRPHQITSFSRYTRRWQIWRTLPWRQNLRPTASTESVCHRQASTWCIRAWDIRVSVSIFFIIIIWKRGLGFNRIRETLQLASNKEAIFQMMVRIRPHKL